MQDDEDTARVITVAILVVQAVLVIASTRLLGLITSGAVGIELAIVVVLVIALAVVMVFSGQRQPRATSPRVASPPTRSNYFAVGGGLMAGMIMGLTTLVGFDSAANLAEEAKDPFRSVPRAIVASVVAAAVLGLLFLIALTVAIKDVADVTNSGSPVAAIIRRPARSGRRADPAGRYRARDVRRGDGGHGRRAHGRCSPWPATPLPRARADAAGQPANADPGPRDDPDPRSWGWS